MANLTDGVKLVLMAHELKNNGSPTLLATGVDTTGWGQITWLLFLGAVAAGAKVNLKIQESDDLSTWTDITAKALAEIADTGDNLPYVIEIPIVTASKRYQKPVLVVADGTPGADLCVVAALSRRSDDVAVVCQQALAQVIG